MSEEKFTSKDVLLTHEIRKTKHNPRIEFPKIAHVKMRLQELVLFPE